MLIHYQDLEEFFKILTLTLIGFYTLTVILTIFAQPLIVKLHAKLFNIPPADIKKAVYEYLGFFKILIIVFVVSPYLALLLMHH